MDCVFCRIRDGALPSTKVAEDDRALAIMDINPLNDGHILILTKTHAENLFEIAEEDLVAATRLARRVAAGIRRGLTPDGLNLVQANGAAAFQSVPHFHIHLIPRWMRDGKGFDWTLHPGDPERIRTTAERIRAALAGQSASPPAVAAQ
jgi:histidine triad (HIT) family protein